MTREQLIDYLEFVLRPSGRAVTFTDFNLLPDILSALRGLGWVRTADRLPTEEDAIEVHNEWGFTHKEVAVLSSGWPFEALVKDIPAMLPGIMDIETIEDKTTTFPYWMPLPKPPEVEE